MTNGTIDTEEERRNVEALRRAYEGYGRGDPQPFFDMCAPDIRYGIAAAPEHFVFAGVRSGMDWVKHVLTEINKEFEWLEFGPRQLIAEGEWVIALGGGRIRDRETGELIEPDLVDVIQMKDGKVVYFVEYFDTSLMQKRDAARAKLINAKAPRAKAVRAKAVRAKAGRRTKARAKPKRTAAAAKRPAKAKAAPPKRAAAKRTAAKAAAKPKRPASRARGRR